MRTRSTSFRSARSCFPRGFVGLVIQGSISTTCPAGVTRRNAECPYQVRRVLAVPAVDPRIEVDDSGVDPATASEAARKTDRTERGDSTKDLLVRAGRVPVT